MMSTLSVEVVLSCSLTGAVRESSLGWSLCFFLRVGEHGWSGEISCVKHVRCAYLMFLVFLISRLSRLFCFQLDETDLSETSRYRHCCGAAKCDTHCEWVHH